MCETKHRFRKAEGHGTGTFPASSDRVPPPGDTGGGYSPPLSRTSSFVAREKNPVHKIVSRWDGEHSSPPIHFYYPCGTNTLNNDIFVDNPSIDSLSTVSPFRNYTDHKSGISECVFIIRYSNLDSPPVCPIDDSGPLPESLLTVYINGQESGYNSKSWELDPPDDFPLTGNPPGNLPNFHSSGASFSLNKVACVSSRSTKFSPMDCSSSNSYADD
jgi:hypothetical protein